MKNIEMELLTDFLERLLAALYGEEWRKLTIYDAKEWHEKHIKEELGLK